MTNKRKNPFKLPKDYFSFLEKEVLIKTKTNFSGYGFKTSKSYFKNLEEDIIEKTIGKNNFYKRRNNYLLSIIFIAASIFLYYNLSISSETLIIKENKISFDDYIENYYMDDLNSYEIISMLDEDEINYTFKYD